ncbi:hypothetical protein ACRPM7_11930 [Burkholderia vietnamiensis]|uniref:hypothetical protein n=1 Tax=Burkholderia vietnamiensis TaxID=60552 RepID=UPI0007559338|nr:hypothetical protein [Burkholderia vietnamiensis]MDN8114384.1 hypothetical protein [Burkholderia vietnamiensis]QTK86456.1 hypothetical protein J4D21_22000 [Burkholderia vietnamiensis]HDR9136329.1 hypothetical protein [Burkholderia vietnamiensis]HDR9317253.1 hypothetical protein [Burkholderia vietnamiensis]
MGADEGNSRTWAAVLAAESEPSITVVRCRLLSEERVRHAFGIERAALADDVAAGRVFPISVDDGDYYRAWLDSHTEE